MIRAYRSDDLAVVVDMGNRAWAKIHEMYNECYGDELFEILFKDADIAKGRQIQSHCTKHPDWVFICEREDRIVGFITFGLDTARKIGEIGNNARDPECKLKGIGQEMYEAVFQYFLEHGMQYAKVGTGLDKAHVPACRAYERAGFNLKHEDVTYCMKL